MQQFLHLVRWRQCPRAVRDPQASTCVRFHARTINPAQLFRLEGVKICRVARRIGRELDSTRDSPRIIGNGAACPSCSVLADRFPEGAALNSAKSIARLPQCPSTGSFGFEKGRRNRRATMVRSRTEKNRSPPASSRRQRLVYRRASALRPFSAAVYRCSAPNSPRHVARQIL